MRLIRFGLLCAALSWSAACDKPAEKPAEGPPATAEAPADKPADKPADAPAAPAKPEEPAVAKAAPGADLLGVYVRAHKVPPMQDGPDVDARDCLKLEAADNNALRFTVVSIQGGGMSCGFSGLATPEGEGAWSYTNTASNPEGPCTFKIKRTDKGVVFEDADDALCAGNGCGMNASINGVTFETTERKDGEACALN